MLSYLDDGDDVGCGFSKLGGVDIKVGQVVSLGLFVDEARPFSDSMNAS